MKKLLIVMLAAYTSLSFGKFAVAEGTNSEAKANLEFNYNYDSTYHDSPDISPQRQDSNSTFSKQPILKDGNKGDGQLDDLHFHLGWKILKKSVWNVNGIRVSQAEALSTYWVGTDVDATEDEVIDTTDDLMILVPFSPMVAGVFPVVFSKAILGKEKRNLENALMTAVYKAWSKKKCKYITILYNSKYITQGKVLSLGTSGVLSTVLKDSTKPQVAAGAIGGGIGGSKAWIYDEPLFKVIGYNKRPPDPEQAKAGPEKDAPAKGKTVDQKKPEKIEEPMVKLGRVRFAHNSATVAKDQLTVIQGYADYIAKAPLKNNEYWEIRGSASKEGSNKHNWDLAGRRGKNVCKILARLKLRQGWESEKAQAKIRFDSKGEYFPDYEEKQPPGKDTVSNNRQAYLIKVTEVTPK